MSRWYNRSNDHLAIEDVVTVASTLNVAYALGKGVEVGKEADILILDISDYRDLAYRFGGKLVAGVFKGGQSIWPKEVA